MKTYNKPQTLVAAIACNQGICQIASPTELNLYYPSEYGTGGDAN